MWTLECDSNILDRKFEQKRDGGPNLTGRGREKNMVTPGEEVSVREDVGSLKGKDQYADPMQSACIGSVIV